MNPLALLVLVAFPPQDAPQEQAPVVHPSAVPSWPLWPGEGTSVRGAETTELVDRWVLGARLIDDDIGVDRARQRFTLVYRFTDAFQAGLEWNPLADDVGLLANWRVLEETVKRPALILGTSSDRIGTTEGRSLYATLSKSLERELGLPLAPYGGVVYGGEAHEFDAIGGLHVAWGKGIESLHFHDGHNLHHVVTKTFGRHAAGLLLAEQDDDHFLGVSYTVTPRARGRRLLPSLGL